MKGFRKSSLIRIPWASVLLSALLFLVTTGTAEAGRITTDASVHRLENGFTVILKEDHSSPVASVQLWVKTGSANETEEEAGITHLIEHMIFKGTPTRKTGEIARAIESCGGHINAYTTLDRTVYYVEIPSRHVGTGIEIVLDALRNSLFDPEELGREKEVVLEEYRRTLDTPQRRLDWAVMRLAYQKHPYGRPIIGYPETIGRFERQHILKYMDIWYRPENMILVAVGAFDSADILKKSKAMLRDFVRRPLAVHERPEEPVQTILRKKILSADVRQVYMELAWHIPSLTHPDISALEVLELILGQGRSSRLYHRLKMAGSLVHQIDTGIYPLTDPGLFSINATLSPAKVTEALRALSEEIRSVTLEPVLAKELDRAKTQAEADFVFELETMAGQAKTLGFFQTMTGDICQADHYLERVKAVTPEDVLRVARTYLRPENLCVALMVPEGTPLDLQDNDLIRLFSQDPRDSRETRLLPRPGTPSMITLDNGIRLILKEDSRVPAVSFSAAFLGGSRLEPKNQWGISAFVANMLTRGTQTKTASEIALAVESKAGQLEGFSGKNSFGISGKFLKEDLRVGLELMAEVILQPTFPQDQMAKVREDMLAHIRSKEDRPTALLFDLFYETLFSKHPYGHPMTGTKETIESITQTDLVGWYRSFAVPSNMVLALVGDFQTDSLVPLLKTLFLGLSPSSGKLPPVAPEPPLTGVREKALARPLHQTHMAVGYLDANLLSPYNAPMTLIETALSGQGGRLFRELRDKQGLAYAVGAFRSSGLENGAFGLYVACDPKKTAKAKEALFQEMERIRETGLTPQEISEAKAYFLGNLQIGLQTYGRQALQMALDELYGLGYDYLPRFIQQIESVSLEDVKRAAHAILTGKYIFVTVGPK